MKKTIFALALLISANASAVFVADTDAYLDRMANLVTSDENSDLVYGACNNDRDIEDASVDNLFNAALDGYNRADEEFRFIKQFYLEDQRVFMVNDVVEGNGCCHYYTNNGSFLASYCGGESTDWSWD